MAREDLVGGLNLRRCVGNAMLWEMLQGEIRYEGWGSYRKVRYRKDG